MSELKHKIGDMVALHTDLNKLDCNQKPYAGQTVEIIHAKKAYGGCFYKCKTECGDEFEAFEFRFSGLVEPKFEVGEEVEVTQTGLDRWSKRYLVAKYGDEYVTSLNKNYAHLLESWDRIRKFGSKPQIEIDIKINGKTCKLKDLSEQTLLKIREQS